MDIVDKSWDIQRKIEEKAKRIGRGKYGRILRMARKPTTDEYIRVLQITGLGILLIGAVGFLIFLIMVELPKMFA
ncbi:MAG: protein translocase SEC61 complex subunit gamma [Thermoplasmata archaeon]|nr:protein translocase SEC61 complex subunit gamma [Candidatus Thermoplasmatota archaeon]MCK4458042.1 protein translocase SEC61 complex subunit gamma [Thermoplasmata archaeon]